MSKLPLVSSEKIIKSLLKAGFDYAPIKGKGSHTAFIRVDIHGEKYLVIIPKRDVPKGTLISIIKQSGVNQNAKMSILNLSYKK